MIYKFLFIVVFFFILFVIFHLTKTRVETFHNFFLITYDNEPYYKTNTKNLVYSLNKFKYNYILLGENNIWRGWYGRFQSYFEQLSKMDKEDYVLICDGRDVLINNQKPEEFLKKAEKLCNLEKKIIFGAERHCCCHIPERYGRFPSMKSNQNLSEIYKNFMKKQVYKKFPDYKYDYFYLNFGLFFGKVKNILWMFSNLNMGKKLDDQGMSYIFFYKYPEKIYVDSKQILFGNNGHNDCDLEYYKGKFKNKITNTYPVFLHFPGYGELCYQKVLQKII